MSELAQLIDRYYRAWFRFHPETATDLDIEGYDHLLPPFDDDDLGALDSLNQKLLEALDALDTTRLSPDQQLDVTLMRGAALLELEAAARHDWRHRDPLRFLPVNAIFQLTLRRLPERGEAMRARLRAIPRHLREARTFLRQAREAIPAPWLQMAIDESRQGVVFLRELRQHPQVIPLHVDAELESAGVALNEYADFLARSIGERAQGDFACGREHFDLLLRYRHGLDIDADQLHALGERLYARVRDELLAETRRLRGDTDVAAMADDIVRRHPPPDDLLGHYRTAMEAARAFVADRDLLTLPDRECLQVVETPVFLRHLIPFAAYREPPPGDPRQQGWYWVTPPADAAERAEHNRLAIRHVSVHEAWPGHHCHFVTANRNPVASTLPRLTNPSALCYEGWALYCEQLMHEQGFLDAPESRFVLLRDRLWRVLRILLDVELHTRGLGFEEAASRLERELGFPPAQARAEIAWYTREPTVPMGYATGWALITAARARLTGSGDGLSLKAFHDRLLAEGTIGLPWVLRRQFGEPLWQSLRRSLLDARQDADFLLE